MTLAVTGEVTHPATAVSHPDDLGEALAGKLLGKKRLAGIRFLDREFSVTVTKIDATGNGSIEIEGKVDSEFIGEDEHGLPQPTGYKAVLTFTNPWVGGHSSVCDELYEVTGTITVFPLVTA